MSKERYRDFEQVNGATVNDALDRADLLIAEIKNLTEANAVLTVQLAESRGNDRTGMLWLSKIKAAAQHDGDFPALIELIKERNPNAHWLTLAHMLCTDLGAPPGHIEARLNAALDRGALKAVMP